jgi:hypothetical protein
MARRSAVAALLIVGSSLVGCYTLQPTRGARPNVGENVAFDVNDAGRVALGGSLGPEISQIEGRVLGSENGEYVLAVSNIKLLRGGEQVWTGEHVRIKSDYVGTTYERKLSRPRTIAVGVAGAGLVAFFVTRSIKGSGQEDQTNVPSDTAQSQLIPIRIP